MRRYERFAVRQNLGAGRIHSARSFFKLGFPQKRQLLWDSDLPWSMWAMIEKLRMWSCFVIELKTSYAAPKGAALLVSCFFVWRGILLLEGQLFTLHCSFFVCNQGASLLSCP